MYKEERYFILTIQTYNKLSKYKNKIDEMHKKSMKCTFKVFFIDK